MLGDPGPIELSTAERRRLTEYVTGPFNPQASVGALTECTSQDDDDDDDLEAWWTRQKAKAGAA